MIPGSEKLLVSYFKLAEDFTDAATPQENFLATISSDWRYERALQGVRLLAQHHVGQVVQALIAWRQNINEDIKKKHSVNNVVNIQGVCKRAAMEVLFLEASLQVLDEFEPDFWRDRQFQNFFDSMQHVAFRWLLNADEYVSHPELAAVRQHVVLVSSRLVGAMSHIRLSDITNSFVKKLEERVLVRKDSAPRAVDVTLLRSQALKLCAGMKNVILSFESDSQLEQCTRFLHRAHPLNYTAAVKKSQLHHALCEMLTDILSPLIRLNQPHGCGGLSTALMTEWYAAVLRLKNDIGLWINKHSKHTVVGYPLVTVLVCLVDNQNYAPLLDSMTDFLTKQMKAAAANQQTVAWLDRVVKPLLTSARKGGIPQAEQQDFVSDVADLSPEYCVGSIIPDLLQSESYEAQLIALRTLHLVVTSVPSGSSFALQQRVSTPRRSMALAAGQRSCIKRMVQLVAGCRTVAAGTVDTLLHLACVHTAIACNNGWLQIATSRHSEYFRQPSSGGAFLCMIINRGYIAHAEGAVRASACDALMGTIRGCPMLRGLVLSNMAAFLASVPDEAVQTTRECLLLLRNLMELWLGLLQEQRLDSSNLDCSAALDLLRTLHLVLRAMAEQQGVSHSQGSVSMSQHKQQLASTPSLIPSTAAGTAAGGGSSFTSTSSAAVDGATAGAAVGASSSSLGISAMNSATGGSGVFSRHKPAMSRDSAEFMLQLGQLETPDAGVTCIMDVLEEVGADVARRCYWDFGDWSDLWRETKQVPLDVGLNSVMAASDEVGRLRWMRCLVELARAACHMCPTSMGVAYLEMLHKLARYVSRDSAGRIVLPGEGSQEGRRSDAWKAFVVVACVCPPSLREKVEKAAARKGAGLTARDLIRALLASLTSGAAVPQQVFLMALGHCSSEHYPVLFEELPALMDDYQRQVKQRRGTARPEEVRKLVANVLRLVADAMPQGTLASQGTIRARFLDWLRDTIQYLRGLPPFGEAFWEVSQVAYCLCAVCHCITDQLVGPLTLPVGQLRDSVAVQHAMSNKSNASEASTTSGGQMTGQKSGGLGDALGITSSTSPAGQEPMTRKVLFYMFAAWCEDGKTPANDYHTRLSIGMSTALAQVKEYDTDTRESLRQELTQAAELLDQASRMAMAAVLQGAVFDTDAKRAEGPVLSWINRMMTSSDQVSGTGSTGLVPGVPRDSIGRTALFKLLSSNLDMFGVCVDRCYHSDSRIATGTFQVVSEVYALTPVKVEAHVVLSLVLYKMVDSNQEVREDALNMLHVLSTREWQASAAELAAVAAGAGAGWNSPALQQQRQQEAEVFALEAEGGSGTVVVLGALQDSYQQFQYQLAAKLARDHPELSEALCEEMMTRQLELADKVSQHPVLTCLGPWMENLSIAAHWKGTWCERLLKSMYYVTLSHGDELPLEIERLWSTLAANRRNIIPILDFLTSLGTHMAYQELNSMLEFLGVSKRICLYLARISPQQTIDHLVYEISLQLHEEEGAAAAAAAGTGAAAGVGGKLSPSPQPSSQPLEFASVLELDAASARYFSPSSNHQVEGDQAVRTTAGGSNAAGSNQQQVWFSVNSWWMPGGGSSLMSSTAAGAGGGQGVLGTATAGAAGLLAGVAGLLGSSGGLAASYPPSATPATAPSTGTGLLSSSFASQVSSSLGTEPSAVPRGMRLSGTITGALGLGNSNAATAAASTAATPGSGGDSPGFNSLVRHSVTEQSDSSRSSLSISASTPPGATEQSAQAGAGAAGSFGSIVPAGAAAGLPRSATAGPRVVAAGEQAGDGSGATVLNLGSYYAGGAPAGGAGGREAAGTDLGLSGSRRGTSASVDAWQPSGRKGEGRGGQREPPAPALRGLVTRPELALCLLTEVAYEHDEDFSSHLALLCQVSLLLVDHEEQLVAAAAQQLLINCLYSLSARQLELVCQAQEDGQQVECLQATHLIKYLQSMKGRRLWSYEDLSLHTQQELPSAVALAGLVQHCLEALSFEPGLPAAWCDVALEWALHARNRHLACRSQQALRALRPALTGDMCGTLLLCLQQCLAAAANSQVAREVCLELLLTLRSLLNVMPARKLLLYPQLFWTSLLLLFTSYVHIYQQAILMLSSCLEQLPLQDVTTQNVLLAAAPASSQAELKLLLASSNLSAIDSESTDKLRSWQQQSAAEVESPSAFASTADHKVALGSKSRSGTLGATASSSRGHGSPSAVTAGTAALPSVAPSTSSHMARTEFHEAAVPGPAEQAPAAWPVGKLLPWPERGADGPAHQMIAMQQMLFKGLLFADTQLHTVRLTAQLAQGLLQLPASAGADMLPSLGMLLVTGPGGRKVVQLDDGQPGPGPGLRQQPDWQHGAKALHGTAGASRVFADKAAGDASLTTSWPSAAAAVSRSAPDLTRLTGRGNKHRHSTSAAGSNPSAVPGGEQEPWTGHRGLTSAQPRGWGELGAGKGIINPAVAAKTVGACSLPGGRNVYQSLLGQCHAQLLVSIASIVPFFCSQLGQLEPDSELLGALQGLCQELSRALLPAYAGWLLRFWMGVLLLPGAAALHPHVLLLLRCLFDVPDLQLGPAGVALVVDINFLSPLVTLSQGLAACLLPQLDVVDLLQRVLDSNGIRPRRKKYRLLPFLAEPAMADIHQAVDRLSDE
eukprot:gene13221-13351_t